MTTTTTRRAPFDEAWAVVLAQSSLTKILWIRPKAVGPVSARDRRLGLLKSVTAIVLLASIPALALIVSNALPVQKVETTDYPLAGVLIVINIVMLASASIGFRFINNRTNELRHSFRSQFLGSWLTGFVRRYFSIGVQAAFLLVPAGGIFVLIQIWSATHAHQISGNGTIFAVWTTALGGLSLQWMLVFPILAHALMRAPTLRLVQHDPASTEWIQTISRIVSLAGLFIAVIAFALAVVNVTMTTRSPAPGSTIELATRVLAVVVLVLLAVTIVSCGVPAWQITTIVTTAKRLELRRLDKKIRALRDKPGVDHDDDGVLQLIGTYRAISDAPDAPFSTASIVQYIAVIIGAILSLLLPTIWSAIEAAISN